MLLRRLPAYLCQSKLIASFQPFYASKFEEIDSFQRVYTSLDKQEKAVRINGTAFLIG
jgi:hypothetical protein